MKSLNTIIEGMFDVDDNLNDIARKLQSEKVHKCFLEMQKMFGYAGDSKPITAPIVKSFKDLLNVIEEVKKGDEYFANPPYETCCLGVYNKDKKTEAFSILGYNRKQHDFTQLYYKLNRDKTDVYVSGMTESNIILDINKKDFMEMWKSADKRYVCWWNDDFDINECDGCATPGNTMGMGNPMAPGPDGEVGSGDTFDHQGRKAKLRRKKKRKEII